MLQKTHSGYIIFYVSLTGRLQDMQSGYPLKLYFQIPYVFPVFSLSDLKFSLFQFTSFVTTTSTKLTMQLQKNSGIFVANIELFFTFKIREFTTCAKQIPCVLPKLPNFPCFP